jgi:hypothetical protein
MPLSSSAPPTNSTPVSLGQFDDAAYSPVLLPNHGAGTSRGACLELLDAPSTAPPTPHVDSCMGHAIAPRPEAPPSPPASPPRLSLPTRSPSPGPTSPTPSPARSPTAGPSSPMSGPTCSSPPSAPSPPSASNDALAPPPLLLLPCALTCAVAAVFTGQRNAPMAGLPGLLPA